MRASKQLQLEVALDAVQMTQEAFWDAMNDLEKLLGRELDSSVDYSNYKLEDLGNQ